MRNFVQVSVRDSYFNIARESLNNTNDVAAAWCFGARNHVPLQEDVRNLAQYDGLFVTMWKIPHYDRESRWMDIIHRYKDAYPNKPVILHQEAEAEWFLVKNSHEWRMQKDMMSILKDKVDIFLAHTHRSMEVYSAFMSRGKAFVWDTVQDIDKIKQFRVPVSFRSNIKNVGVSTYDGRANGLIGIAVASELTENIVQISRSTYNDDRNEFVPKFFGVDPLVIPEQGWFDWLRGLAKIYVYVHPMPAASAGRDTIACAALGIPVIGNEHLDCQINLFPELATDCYAVSKMKALLHRLLNDHNFYVQCTEFANERFDRYSIDNGILRAENILLEARL